MGSDIRLVRVAVSACRSTTVLKGFDIRLILFKDSQSFSTYSVRLRKYSNREEINTHS